MYIYPIQFMNPRQTITIHRLGFTGLRKSLRSIALIWLHNFTTSKLSIRVRRVNDLLVANNRQSLETLTSAELARPGGTNDKVAALDALVGGARCWRALGDVVTGGGLATVVGVDGVCVLARSVGCVADALEVLHGPGLASSHHGDGIVGWLGDWVGQRAASDGEEGGEGGDQLHDDKWSCWVFGGYS